MKATNRDMIKIRQRRILRQLNREIQAKKERRASAWQAIDAVLIAIVVVIGLMVLVCAAEIRAAEDAQAAVLRDHRIRPERLAQYQDTEDTGLQAEDPYIVEPLPAAVPPDGEPPEAIEIVTMDRIAAEAETMDVQAGEWESLGTFKTTGYCNCRKCAGRWAGGATASGAMPEEGVTIAVDRSVIPLGAHILIDGHEFVAQDTGVRGKHIDVYYEDHDDAWDHGTQHKQVFIWREE